MSREEILKEVIPITEWNELERKMAIISRMTADREFFPYESSIYGGKPKMASSMNTLEQAGAKILRLSATDALDMGLQPIELEIDITDLDVDVMKFPRPDCYLLVKSRSDDAQTFIVLSHHPGEMSHDAFIKSIKYYFGEAEYVPLRLGDEVELKIAGKTYSARKFTTGRGPSRMLWYAALVPKSSERQQGVVVVIGRHIRRKDLADEINLIDDPVLYQIISSLKIGN